MTVELVPDRLRIPLRTAGALAFRGPKGLSARDISYAFLVAWIAGQDGMRDWGEMFLGGNGLRMALARSRRDGIAKEEDRHFRLDKSVFAFEGEEYRFPHLEVFCWPGSTEPIVHRGGLFREGDAQQKWYIHRGVPQLFHVPEGERWVEIETHLLRHAMARYTIHVAMRMAAWAAGGIEGEWLVTDEPGFQVIRMPVDDVVTRMDLDKAMPISQIMDKVIEPAMEEINRLTSWEVGAKVLTTAYRAGPGRPARAGKPKAVEFRIAFPVPEEQPAVRYPPKRKFGKTWRRPVARPGSRPKPVEEPVQQDAVVQMPPRGFASMVPKF